ncbi:nucleotidyltransferase domain-containing protein [Candidatus Woesearchaeota archaeon]|nr:nucleotidyltransferase domain-containing protein [Candidatus Woesearchaeota archaeon]
MNTNLKISIEFSDKIKEIKGILQIVLFGSVARGEDTYRSDIDIAIIHNLKDKFELMKKINKHKPDKVQITIININDLAKETELVGALSGEGLMLHGSPIYIQERKLELKAKLLISYSLTELQQTEKVKVNRALYGSVSKSISDGKEYVTTTRGYLNQHGFEKISDCVLLVERKLATHVIATLKRYNVKYKEIALWTY